jgi:methylation protein EvaC
MKPAPPVTNALNSFSSMQMQACHYYPACAHCRGSRTFPDEQGQLLTDCAACGAAIEPQISLGRMPLANGFLRREDFATEFFYDLKAGLCGHCGLAQLLEHVPPERMFHDRYPFQTSGSVRMSKHFRELAQIVVRQHLPAGDPFVVEIGSNDGTLLRVVAEKGIRHLGVDASANVVAEAKGAGVRSLCRFFDEAAARDIVSAEGRADVVLAANCFCHIRGLNALAAGLRILLKPDGLLIFEDPYLGDIVRQVAYDQIYDEHAYYFSVTSTRNWLSAQGLELIGAEPQDVHGGSMRYTAAHKNRRAPSPAVAVHCRAESMLGLDRPTILTALQQRIDQSRSALVALLQRLKREGKRVVGYGATSKSTTVLNYCGITPDLLEFISDSTLLKQGRFTPGTHIPVLAPAAFSTPYPEYALLLAWNHAAEILEKETEFRRAGGKWIGYVPEVGFLSA